MNQVLVLKRILGQPSFVFINFQRDLLIPLCKRLIKSYNFNFFYGCPLSSFTDIGMILANDIGTAINRLH